MNTQVIAHRGNSSVAPENTMAAFESAWRAGADVIELDIQLTADGQAVVIHNDTLDATTDATGPVSTRTAAELGEVDAGSWFAPSFTGQRLPLLRDVLSWLRERDGLGLLVEFKGEWDPAPVSTVVEQIEDAGVGGRIVVQSFAVSTVRALADVAPDLRRGLLIDSLAEDTFSLCAQLRVAQCNPSGLILMEHPETLQLIQDRGMQAMVWTVNEVAHWDALLQMGADGIITDRPDRLRGYLAGRT
ncbi:MAG TPA: glycerophosphodiester phosphodiesterase family protein [Beutenbergiaceae bacterium]|nr:glycerophosphodiester phosphodiesterase family protein [Beutenbergiaceae bacterium]